MYSVRDRGMGAVADPGFPVGGRGPHRGAVDPRGSYVSKILHVKTKESGPVGGHAGRALLDPPMGGIRPLVRALLSLMQQHRQ